MSFITIDCGASFIKGTLFDSDEVLVKRISKATNEIYKKDNDSTDGDAPDNALRQASENVKPFSSELYKIESLIKIVNKIFDELLTYVRDEDVFLGISNEMHGFILADEDDNPITPYISWQCEYSNKEYPNGEYPNGESYTEYLKRTLDEELILSTGMPIKAGLPNTNLFYFTNNSETKILFENQKVYFYTLGDYIIKRLTKKNIFVHPTNAAATGLFDINTGDWNYKLIELIGAKDIIFPDISENSNIEIKRMAKNIKIYPALGDQQAALFGAGISKADEVSYNFGTGAQVSTICEKVLLSNNYQTRPYFEGAYIKTIPHIPSGRAINVFFNFIKEMYVDINGETEDSIIWEYIASKVQKYQSSLKKDSGIEIDSDIKIDSGIETKNNEFSKNTLDIDLSFFTNPITSNNTGHIANITENNFEIGKLFYAIYMQIATNAMTITKKLEVELESVERIIFTGGIMQRISLISEEIKSHYSENVESILVVDETAKGLVKFINLCRKKDSL